MRQTEPSSSHAFTIAQARAAGMSDYRIRRLNAPFSGIRTSRPVERSDLREICRSYAPRLRGWQFFSHETALALHGIPTPSPIAIHVSAHRPAREPRVNGVVGHRLQVREPAARVVDGLPVEHSVRAWRQCASMWRLDDLVAAADALLARGLTTGDLRDEVELMGDRQGLLGRAIAAARFGSESARETHLRLALVRAGLPEPELNLSLYDSRGRFVARLDQAYPQYRVGVEYDGRQHAFDEKQFERDAERWESVRREGWLLVRVLRRHMANDGAAAVSMVREALRESGWIDPGGRRRR